LPPITCRNQRRRKSTPRAISTTPPRAAIRHAMRGVSAGAPPGSVGLREAGVRRGWSNVLSGAP
jgi:hypothetical protein